MGAIKGRGTGRAGGEPMTFKDGKGIFVAGPKELQGVKSHESVLIANISGITAIVSVQMIEASHATISDAVVRDALKTIVVRQQVPESEQLAVLPYKITDLSGFHVIRSGQDGTV